VLDALNIFTLLAVPLALGWLLILNHQHQNRIMATVNERLTAIETALDEAGAEIVSELAKLREQIANGTVTQEALDTLGRIEAKANGLAAIIPNAPPVS